MEKVGIDRLMHGKRTLISCECFSHIRLPLGGKGFVLLKCSES